MASKPSQQSSEKLPLKATPASAGEGWGRTLVGYLMLAYVALILAGVFGFLSPRSIRRGNEMSACRAVVASVNAATLTGFQVQFNPNDYENLGKNLFLLLSVSGSLLTLIVGGLAVKRILRLPYSDGRVVVSALVAVAAAAMIGSIGFLGGGVDPREGLSKGISAFGNCGAFIGSACAIDDWKTHVFLLPLALLGGLGLTVLMELIDWLVNRRPLSHHTRTVLVWTAGCYLFFGLLFMALRRPQMQDRDWATIQPVLASCWVQAINSRTAGLPFEYSRAFPATMQWALMLAMIVGASSGGTGGGLKTTTLAELLDGTRRALSGKTAKRTFGIALVWLGIYLAMLAAATIALTSTESQMSGDKVLFMAISALSNVGLSHDPLNPTPAGQFILSAVMLCGRMAPLLILWWIADTVDDAQLALA